MSHCLSCARRRKKTLRDCSTLTSRMELSSGASLPPCSPAASGVSSPTASSTPTAGPMQVTTQPLHSSNKTNTEPQGTAVGSSTPTKWHRSSSRAASPPTAPSAPPATSPAAASPPARGPGPPPSANPPSSSAPPTATASTSPSRTSAPSSCRPCTTPSPTTRPSPPPSPPPSSAPFPKCCAATYRRPAARDSARRVHGRVVR